MTSTPAVWFRIAGVLFGIACASQDDSGAFPTRSGSQPTANPEVLARCTSYCNHVYANATGCDGDVLAAESAGCHAFCSVQATAVAAECAESIGDAYSCVVDQSIAYACSDEDDSPQPMDDACAAAWTEADGCMGNQ